MSSSTSLVRDYKVGLKREIERALGGVFGDTYPDPNFRNKVQVHLDFPMQEEAFPAVYLTYQEGQVENVGVGHVEAGLDDNGNAAQIRHFRFSGQLMFNIMGRNPLERDTVTEGIINLLSFGRDMPAFKPFYDELFDGQFVKIQVLTDSIQPGGENVITAPWNTEDDRLYTNRYSVPVFGEFWNSPTTGGLIQIETVDLYPYRADQPVPTGSNDPAPWG